MKNIADFLNKFKIIVKNKSDLKEIVTGVFFEETKIKLEDSDYKIKNGTIYLNIKPIYKNEIFFKKEKILEKINSKIENQKIIDIR